MTIGWRTVITAGSDLMLGGASNPGIPDRRRKVGARNATDLPVDLVLGLLWSSATAATFIGVLWSVGGNLTLDAFGLALTISGYLVIAVIVYSMLLTAAMMIIAHRLTRVMQENKRAEAELKSGRSPPTRKRGRHGIAGWQTETNAA